MVPLSKSGRLKGLVGSNPTLSAAFAALLEESHSGLVGATGNRVCQKHRGFESHLLRPDLPHTLPCCWTSSLLDIVSQLLQGFPRARLIVFGPNARRNVFEDDRDSCSAVFGLQCHLHQHLS